MGLTHGDPDSCEAIINSIEKQWSNSDQAPFIAAVILNPLLKTTPFRSHHSFTLAGVLQLLRSLFSRFFPDEEQPQLFVEVSEYLETRGRYLPMEDIISEARKSKASNVGITVHPPYQAHIW